MIWDLSLKLRNELMQSLIGGATFVHIMVKATEIQTQHMYYVLKNLYWPPCVSKKNDWKIVFYLNLFLAYDTLHTTKKPYHTGGILQASSEKVKQNHIFPVSEPGFRQLSISRRGEEHISGITLSQSCPLLSRKITTK